MNNNQYIKKIREQLTELGVKEGGVLFVQASLEALGHIEGGCETLIKAILSVLGSKGTLLMPALTIASVEEDKYKTFHAKEAPSEEGELSEYFRNMEGVIRSMHPTHSVCGCGLYAKDLLDGHKQDRSPWGSHSPYRLISQLGGQILLLGCGLDKNMCIHAIEEKAEVPYLLETEKEYKIFDNTREKYYAKYKTYELADVKPKYQKLEKLLVSEGLNKGEVLQAQAYLIDAGVMWRKSIKALKEDAYYFVVKE